MSRYKDGSHIDNHELTNFNNPECGDIIDIQKIKKMRPPVNVASRKLTEDKKQKSDAGSCSPPPEEIKIDLPDMSALIVQDHSMMNESAQFCLDEIFMQSSQKKKPKTQNGPGAFNLKTQPSSGNKVQRVFSTEHTEEILLALDGSPAQKK